LIKLYQNIAGIYLRLTVKSLLSLWKPHSWF